MEPPPSENEDELRLRARRLAGCTLSDLAGHLSEPPLDLRRAKGWAGEALERALGATSANARARTACVGTYGRAIETLPRGFCLRATFTAGLLRRHFLLP